MTIDIPSSIDMSILDYARAKNLDKADAVIELIVAGLAAQHALRTDKSAPKSGLGLFGGADEGALLDEAVAAAYDARRTSIRPR